MQQVLPAALHHDAAVLEHIGMIRQLERHRDILLNQNDGQSALLMQQLDDAEDFPAFIIVDDKGNDFFATIK